MVRVSRRSALRMICAAGAAAASGCASLTSRGVDGRQPGSLIVRNRDDHPRTVEVSANPASDGPTRRTTVHVDAGARRTRDGFIATPGRYAVEVRSREGEVRAKTTVTYERTDRGTLRGDPIEVVVERGAITVRVAGGAR